MEIQVTTRFHARSKEVDHVSAAIEAIVPPVREEPQCLGVLAYRSLDDPRLFFITSRWAEVSAYERHHELPRTRVFLERVQAMVDEPVVSSKMTPFP